MFDPGWLFEYMLEVRLYIALPVAGVFRTVWLNSLWCSSEEVRTLTPMSVAAVMVIDALNTPRLLVRVVASIVPVESSKISTSAPLIGRYGLTPVNPVSSNSRSSYSKAPVTVSYTHLRAHET